MSEVPLFIRVIPRGVRRAAKEAMRPLADRFLQAYLPGGAGYMGMPHADAKHLPIAPGKLHYILPKASADEPKWEDGFAAPPRELWHGYAPTLPEVMKIGVRNVTKMRAILASSGGDIGPGDRVLDFGCAAGFMIRRLKDIAESGEVWGVDLSGEHVAWCMQHLSPPFRFALGSSFPSLPFPDGYFDLVYCGSVFSHIGEFADTWLLELARVIRPGGRLYLTMVTKESMWRYIREWPGLQFSKDIQEAFTREELESDFAVAVYGREPWGHAVYDLDWFKAKCGMAFEVTRVEPYVYSFQYALVLTRPGVAPTADEVAGDRMSAAGVR